MGVSIGADGRYEFSDRVAPDRACRYHLVLWLPVEGSAEWAGRRIAEAIGCDQPKYQEVTLSPVSLTADQVARLTECEQEIRRQIVSQTGTQISAIVLRLAE